MKHQPNHFRNKARETGRRPHEHRVGCAADHTSDLQKNGPGSSDPGPCHERTTGFEPATFCLGSRCSTN